MKSRLLCLLVTFLSAALMAHSQSYFSYGNRIEPEWLAEIGMSAGAMNCLTDIGGNPGQGVKPVKDINWNQTRPALAVFLAISYHSLFSLKLGLMAGSISGADSLLKNGNASSVNRYGRNLHFKTDLVELSLNAEWYPINFFFRNSDAPLFSPFLSAGIGIFKFNPRTSINGTWVALRPLHTEGEGFPEYPDRTIYKQFSWSLPFGMGILYDAGKLVRFRLEAAYRLTATDYLDDVSQSYINPAIFSRHLPPEQADLAASLADRSKELNGVIAHQPGEKRGDPSNNDAWFSCLLSISLALGRQLRK